VGVSDIEAAGVDEADCGADCNITLLAYLIKAKTSPPQACSQPVTEIGRGGRKYEQREAENGVEARNGFVEVDDV
jgi:hypothetical protein